MGFYKIYLFIYFRLQVFIVIDYNDFNLGIYRAPSGQQSCSWMGHTLSLNKVQFPSRV